MPGRPGVWLWAAALLIVLLAALSHPALALPLPQEGGSSRVTTVGYGPGGPLDLCIGDKKEFTVTTAGRAQVIRNGRPVQVERRVPGVRVDAVVMNPSLGSFLPASQVTAVQPGTSSLDPYNRAVFVFTAKKAGTTSLVFEVQATNSDGNFPWRVGPVQVSIRDCNPAVSVLLDAEINDATYHGSMSPVTLAVADDGTLSGSGVLQWTETAHNSECSALWSVPALLASQAIISGRMSDTSIDVTIAFESITHGVCGACGGQSICIGGGDEFGEISGSFPAEGGDISMQPSGYFMIVLERKTPQAVSALPSTGREVAALWGARPGAGGGR